MVEYTTNRYKVLQKIGEGVHGIVLKAQDLSTNRIVAIKKVSLRTKYGEISLSTLREIKTLQNCDCPYVSLFNYLWSELTSAEKKKITEKKCDFSR